MQAVAVVQRSMRAKEPALEMEALGFGKLLLITSFPVKMSGARRAVHARRQARRAGWGGALHACMHVGMRSPTRLH